MKKNNIILADTKVPNDWEFAEGLKKKTEKEWIIKDWDNAGIKTNCLFYIRKIGGYFSHSFSVFLNRKKYYSIVSWQQFYGILLAFYCTVFHVKKTFNLTIMTFIYKDKKGFLGKIYKRVIKRVLKSKYVDSVIVYSKNEPKVYSDILEVPEELFSYLPLGISSKKELGETERVLPDRFILSVGRSNRDYDFLFKCVKDLPYEFVVLTDELTEKAIPRNVTLYSDVRGDEYLKILQKCEIVAITLKDGNISSGQLVMLQAMAYEKPLIITEAKSINEYVKDGINALIRKKEKNEFSNGIKTLMEDENLRKRLTEAGCDIYTERHSLVKLGESVGTIQESIWRENESSSNN